MRSAIPFCLCSLALIAMNGCSNETSKPTENGTTSPTTDVSTQISDLATRVSALEIQSSKQIGLQLSDTGYTPLQTDIGTLTAQLKSLDANGSGTRVDIVIGNPTSANITELKLTGSWGNLNKDGSYNLNSTHDFSTDASDGVPAASWKHVVFNIDGGRPTDVGFILIKSASIQQMRLYGNP